MEIGVAITSKVGEYLVEPTIKQVRYLFCFKSIVEDLEKEETKLKFARDDVEKVVEIAEGNTKEVKEDVRKWLTGARNVLADVQSLKGEIYLNKTCLNGWCPNWCCQYRLSRKAAKKTSMMLKLRESGDFRSVAHPTTLLPAGGFLTPKDFELFQSTQSALKQIIEALKDDKVTLVGLHGMGGAGKTTLAKAVGDEVKRQKMFDEVVMLVVSQKPDFKNMQGVLADSLGLKLDEETEQGRGMRLYKRFTQTNVETKKKILVILDDAWGMFDLKSKIGFPLGEDNKDCKILLTTREQNLCYDTCQSQISLGLLNDDEGLTLLKQHAGRIDDDSSTWNDLAIKVAKECKGLPLAIATIGRALRGKGVDEWKQVLKKLRNSKLTDISNVVKVDRDVYAILKFSYDYFQGEVAKSCFLLCSLFPEDSEIPLEKLLRYGMGLGLSLDAESIEDARIALRGMVNNLKDSFLLLEANDDEHVKMHDMVRDVALWIASQGKSIFMVKAGMGLTEWPNEESLEQCKAISLMGNRIEVLPNRLFCPALEILLVTGAGRKTKVSDSFFEEVRGLKVLNLSYCDLSLRSIQLLTNLKTLELIACNLTDLSCLVKLNKLEILSFQGSSFNGLPRELGELSKLRLLDMERCYNLKRIPSNAIRRCSQLEELHISNRSFTNWEVNETSTDPKSNGSLYELNSLSRLVKLHLDIGTTCLPKDFTFRNLERFVICLNTDYYESYPRALSISEIEATSLTAFRALFQNVEYFYLNETTGCQNILPSIDQSGFTELKSLELRRCSDLQFIMDTSQQHLPANALSNLAKLKLESLPRLSYIWKGPTHHVNLKTLTHLRIVSCETLEHIFPISIAQGLVQLEELIIDDAPQLKQVFYLDHEEEGEIVAERDEKSIVLPKLRKLTLKTLPSLTSFLPKHYHSTCMSLEELKISRCSSLTASFIYEIKIQDLKEKLRVLEIENCHHELCDELMLTGLRHGFKNLEKLRIRGCAVKVVFPLEGLVTAMDGQQHELLLPNLKELSIEGCRELEQMIIVEEDHMQRLSFPNLSTINVKRCNKLKHVFPITIARSLQKLQYISLEGNSQLELIFGHKGGADVMDDKEFVLPQLEWLFLKALPSFSNFCASGYRFILKLEILHIQSFQEEDRVWDGIFTHLRDVKSLSIENCGVKELKGLWKDSTHILSLQNLTVLYLYNCSQLRHIFPSVSVAQNLSKLERLRVWNCGELDKIIVDEDDIQPPLFPNLRDVDVSSCEKLKRVFPITIARGLQQLKEIYVWKNLELEEVFGERDGGEVKEIDDKAIALPQLRELELQELPRLSNFCPVGYHFIFPSIKNGRLIVRECGKIATRFSLDENESVHAEAKPPKEGATNNEDAQLPPDHPPLDISWHNEVGLDSLRTKLLPYMEKIYEEQEMMS